VGTEATDEDRDLRVVALLGCAAIFAAVVGAWAAVLGDRGSDLWHQAIRDDIRQGARVVSDARRLYEEDAPTAHRVAAYELRAEELASQARSEEGDAAAVLDAEARAQHETAALLAKTANLAPGDPSAALDLDGEALLERFAEIRQKVPPELAGLDPDRVQAEGEDDQSRSALLTLTAVAAGIALLLGALAEALPGSRRRLTNAGFAVIGAGVVAALVVGLA
jgi:broad specificity phosphatase PhoE